MVLLPLLGFALGLFGLNALGPDSAYAVEPAGPPIELAQAPVETPPAAAPEDNGLNLLFGDLVDRLDEVADVIVTTDRYEMTFRLQDNRWVSVDNFDFPIRPDAVPYVFLDLTFLVAGEQLANDPARYAELGVADPGAEGGGERVRIRNAAGEIIDDLIVGNEDTRGGITIRRLDTDEVWTARGAVTIPAYPSEWFDTIIDYRIGDIARVDIMRGETTVLTASKASGNDFTLDFADPAVAPAGATADSRAIRVMSQAAASVTFDGVRPAEGVAIPEDAISVRFSTSSALEVTMTIVPFEGDSWVALAASAPAGSAGVAQADGLNARVAGWLFHLPPSRIVLLGTDPATLVAAP